METYKDHITLTPDMNEERLNTLRELFPDWFTQEGHLDINEVKKAVNPDSVEETERYEFRWFGKSAAKRNAFTPTRATLHYDAERSVNADTTDNIIIEGENLEVLKILSSSYRGKVKCIYIDPPYNTGNDFLYNDDFKEGKEGYWERTEIKQDGVALDTNTENDGRFHSNWLDMMYSRLLVARNLLRSDGVIFISIDDHEEQHLRKICDEIFGEENFKANISWQKRYTRSNNTVDFTTVVEHILVYAKSCEFQVCLLPRTEDADGRYSNPDNDPRGDWKGASFLNPATPEERPNLCYPITNPNTGEITMPTTNAWRRAKVVYEELLADNRLYWGLDGKSKVPSVKMFLSEARGLTPINLWSHEYAGNTDDGTDELLSLLGTKVFDFPKPSLLIQRVLEHVNDKECLVLDFFGGSGTTGNAIVNQNIKDGGSRKFILVQIPEKTAENSNAHRSGFKTISEITIARNKAVHDTIKASYSGKLITSEDQQQLNQLGFKVFTLSKSSFPRVDFAPDPDKSEEENLALFQEYVSQKEQQLTLAFNEDELMTEILIKQGFMLTYKLEAQPHFTQNRVYKATDGVKTAFITVDSQLYDETVDYFMQHTDTKFICIERALDTTKKFNLKNKMQDKFFAF
jgi:Adenine specific DNA methylase Mod